MKRRWHAWVVVVCLVMLFGAAGAAVAQPAPTPQGGGAPQGGAPPSRPAAGEDRPFDEVVKDMEVIKGFFTFYRKADENKLMMEILPEQMDKVLLFSATLAGATGERGVYGSHQAGHFPFVFRRIGKSIQMVQKNTRFPANGSAPIQRANSNSFADAIVGSARMQSKTHSERKSLLIDLAELFVADWPGFAPGLSQAYQPTNFRFDRANSWLGTARSFPENSLVEVLLHYTTDNARTPSITLADPRSVPILMRYELSYLRPNGYKPRQADDRIGFGHVVHQDFSTDLSASPYLRYIRRWDLQKANPSAKVSPPKEPIVYWIENTVPVEYRDSIREGVLLWNKAFEKAGFKDAVVVKQQPDDADWDASDSRYTTIRWFTDVDAGYAIGLSRANPYTGQIFDADIGIGDGIIRGARRSAQEFNLPVSAGGEATIPALRPVWMRGLEDEHCQAGEGLAEQLALGIDLYAARGALTPALEQKMMRQFMIWLSAHEVGHTLGLRHNFRGSNLLKSADLNDVSKTEGMGQSASVMDYIPFTLAAKGQTQGDFMPTTLGPYDYWAIEYGYATFAGDEESGLARIASRAADPQVPYLTDEDSLGTFSPLAIDPRANQWDQSSDVLTFIRERFSLVQELWKGMDAKLVKPGEGYQPMRRAVGRGLNQYFGGLMITSKYVGGVYHHRSHKGDPNEKSPYQPVPAAEQREALDFLRVHAFGENAFKLPAATLNKLAIERMNGLDPSYFQVQRIDYPYHASVLGVQAAVLNRLLHPITLARIQDNELRFAPREKSFLMADLFRGLDAAIWSELDAPAVKVSSLRRNLQREYLKSLIRLIARPAPPGPPQPGGVGVPRPPEDATTLARASLSSLQARIRKAAATTTDYTSRAHLEETAARINSALQAQMEKAVE